MLTVSPTTPGTPRPEPGGASAGRTQTHTHTATRQAGEIDKRWKKRWFGLVLSRQIGSRKHWDALGLKVQCGEIMRNHPALIVLQVFMGVCVCVCVKKWRHKMAAVGVLILDSFIDSESKVWTVSSLTLLLSTL